MHPETSTVKRALWDRANDLEVRDWSSRLSRFLRARLRRWCLAGAQLADDPRVIRAWRRHWDGGHYIQLRRWRDEGFRPRTVYDIGAHQGLWAEMCQEIFSPEQCLLFEPQTGARAQAAARQPRAGGRWQILPVALGDRSEMQSLHVTRTGAASSLLSPLGVGSTRLGEIQTVGEEKVEVARLDDLFAAKGLPRPDLVKIDVQGFEGRVLAGGRETLEQAQRMVIEVSLHPLYDGQSLMPEVLQTLSSWGFELQEVQETFRQWPGRLWQVDLWLSRKK